jgi:uncharacterized protein GlcG (DUF336 family)
MPIGRGPSLAQANQAIEAALARAREFGFHISVSVCDADCYLIAHQRMDGALGYWSRESLGKAIAAAGSGRPSEERSDGIVGHSASALAFARGDPVLHQRGGLPIIRQDAVEGALGVSGAPTNEQDEVCARAGINVLDHGT